MGQLQYISTTNGAFNSVLAQNVTQDSVIEAKFLSTDYSTIIYFGDINADVIVRHWYGTDDMYWHAGGVFQIESYWTLNEEHTVSFSTSEYKFDEHTFSVTGTCNIPATPKFNPQVKGRIYYFKITDNGVDKVNLVAWDENGVLGMKDLVSGTFYQPSSGTWIAGPIDGYETLQYIYNNDVRARFYDNFVITATNNTEVEMQFRVLNPTTVWDGRLFLIGSAYHDCYTQFQQGRIIRCGFQSIPERTTALSDPTAVHTVSVSKDAWLVDGVSLGTLSGTPSVSGNGFSINTESNMLLEIYYITIKDSGVLSHKYLPCEYDGVIGLVDTVEGAFYAPTTGVFYGVPFPTIPINKYKLGTSNVQKTYEGGTKINKMYIGNDLVYRALPTTTGPQLIMPLNEVWYKTSDNNSLPLKSGTYYIDSNGNHLTYTESFDSVSGLWKMVFNGNVYGNQGALYYHNNSTYKNKLLELWLPQGFVRPNEIFVYGQNTFEKFKGDSPAIVDNGNLVVCLVQDNTNTKDYAIQGVKTATTVTVPEGVVAIGGYCFHHLTATTVNFPSTITDIGYGSMEWSNITTLNCYATTAPTVNSYAWYMVSNNGTLHYPVGSDYSNFTVPSSWTKVGDL